MIRCLLAMVGVLVGCSAAVAGPIVSGNFSGLQEVPPRVTQATGFGFVDFSDDLQSARVFAQVSNIENVWLGHIHVGPRGANGPVVFDFLGVLNPTLDVPGTAVLVDRVITAADLTGPFANNFPAFLNAALAGNLYFNIHTNSLQTPPALLGPGNFPGGEVRGQLALVPEPASLLVFGLLGVGGAVAVWRRRKAA